MTALNTQVGGTHYAKMKLQPAEFIHRNGIGFLEGNVIKYVSRHKEKGRANDIRKAIHFCQMILEMEYGECLTQPNCGNSTSTTTAPTTTAVN